jgi:hypothetical protein
MQCEICLSVDWHQWRSVFCGKELLTSLQLLLTGDDNEATYALQLTN